MSLIVLVTFSASIILPRAMAADSTLVFTHVNVIDATGTPAQPDMTVIVRGQRIAEVTKSGPAQFPADAQVVDGGGKYLIPGLWDMHVHTVFGDWLPRDTALTPPGGARQLFLEGRIGSIEPGKDADIAIWDRDLYDVPADDLKDMKCEMTIFAGQIVYEAVSTPVTVKD